MNRKPTYKSLKGGQNRTSYKDLQFKATGVWSPIRDRRCLCSQNTYESKQNALIVGLPKLGKARLLAGENWISFDSSEKSPAICCHRPTGGLLALTGSPLGLESGEVRSTHLSMRHTLTRNQTQKLQKPEEEFIVVEEKKMGKPLKKLANIAK